MTCVFTVVLLCSIATVAVALPTALNEGITQNTDASCLNSSIYEEEISHLKENVQRLSNALAMSYPKPTTPSHQCRLTQLLFPRHNQRNDIVTYKRYFPRLTSGTLCLWVSVDDLSLLVALVSYQSPNNVNSILLELIPPTTFRLVVQGSIVDHTFPMREAEKYHVCAWFDSVQQTSGVYINGEDIGTKGYSGDVVEGGGTFLIGQDQDRNVDGGFHADRSLKGSVDNVMVFPRVLNHDEVERMRVLCVCPVDHVLFMSVDRVEFSGETSYIIPSQCPAVA